MTFPSGSSGLTIGFGVLVLNFEELKTTLYKSNDILLNRNESDTDFILTLPVIPDDNGTRIAVVHYQFVEEINNAIFRLNDSNCWGIKVVGID